jgi:prophage DNA circulation protein
MNNLQCLRVKGKAEGGKSRSKTCLRCQRLKTQCKKADDLSGEILQVAQKTLQCVSGSTSSLECRFNNIENHISSLEEVVAGLSEQLREMSQAFVDMKQRLSQILCPSYTESAAGPSRHVSQLMVSTAQSTSRRDSGDMYGDENTSEKPATKKIRLDSS